MSGKINIQFMHGTTSSITWSNVQRSGTGPTKETLPGPDFSKKKPGLQETPRLSVSAVTPLVQASKKG